MPATLEREINRLGDIMAQPIRIREGRGYHTVAHGITVVSVESLDRLVRSTLRRVLLKRARGARGPSPILVAEQLLSLLPHASGYQRARRELNLVIRTWPRMARVEANPDRALLAHLARLRRR